MDPNRYRRLMSLNLQAAERLPSIVKDGGSRDQRDAAVEISVDGLQERFPLQAGRRTSLVIGRSRRCDIRLASPVVSARHAFLQRFQGGVYCLDLGSEGGTFWNCTSRPAGWLTPEQPVSVGPFTVRCHITYPEQFHETRCNVENLVSRAGFYLYDSRPAELVTLNVLTGEPMGTWSIQQPITLLGRSPLCRPRINHPSVSRVHCSLTALPRGLLLADLRTRAGTWVNGRRYRTRRLRHGDVIRMGEFRLAVNYPDVSSRQPADDESWKLDTPPPQQEQQQEQQQQKQDNQQQKNQQQMGQIVQYIKQQFKQKE